MTAGNPFADQFMAAQQDAARRVQAMETDDYTVSDPGPVTTRVMSLFISQLHGPLGHHCDHIMDSPSVVYGFAAAPGVVACEPCHDSLVIRFNEHWDRKGHGRPCDACGNFVGMGKTGVLQHGPVLLTITMCLPCAEVDGC